MRCEGRGDANVVPRYVSCDTDAAYETPAFQQEGHMTELHAEVLFDAKGKLSESPQWSREEQALYWVDIENGLLHRFEWRRRSHECVSLPAPVTMVVPGPPLLVSSGNRLLHFDWHTREPRQIAALPLDPARVRFNDGKIDPRGRLWLGTMAVDEKSPIAGLYRLVGQTLERLISRGATNQAPGSRRRSRKRQSTCGSCLATIAKVGRPGSIRMHRPTRK
jgi:sugar lactone lactonase YvrE